MTANSLAENRRACVGAAREGLPARAGVAGFCGDLWLRVSGRRTADRRASRGIAASGGAVDIGAGVGLARRVRAGLCVVFGDDPASLPVRREWLDALLDEATWHQGARSEAVKRQDPADVGVAAHTLEGVATSLCAASVAELCGELEDDANTGRFEAVAGVLTRLRAGYAYLSRAIGTPDELGRWPALCTAAGR